MTHIPILGELALIAAIGVLVTSLLYRRRLPTVAGLLDAGAAWCIVVWGGAWWDMRSGEEPSRRGDAPPAHEPSGGFHGAGSRPWA